MKRLIQLFLTFIITSSLLKMISVKVGLKVLIIERFFPDFVNLEIFLISIYAMFVFYKLQYSDNSSVWRLRFWSFFSIVFFSQFILGLLVDQLFLQTGAPHIPIPSLIVSGPIYRGSGYSMLILFVSIILFIGPAWCSHICYIGSWDNIAAKISSHTRDKYIFPRLGFWILLVVLAVPLMLRMVNNKYALYVSISLFALISIFIILFRSTSESKMVHCSRFCPIGYLATRLGKVNPFRIKILPSCSSCSLCYKVCKYSALSAITVKSGAPGLTCTNCGDCIDACPDSAIVYSFFKLSPSAARISFNITVAVVHSVTMAVARL